MSTIPGLSYIANDYDVFFIDIHGVVHDGAKVFPGAVECLEKLRDEKKEVLFLTNIPERVDTIIEELDSFGISRSLYQHIMSSGQELYESLKDPKGSFFTRLGDHCYFIGPSNTNLLEGLSFERVSSLDNADFIMVTGTDDWHHDLKEYNKILDEAVAKNLPMICANPNPKGFDKGQCYLEAGAIAKAYEAKGGQVKSLGKPDYRYVEKALKLYNETDKSRMIMVGDSLPVDVASGITGGIDTAFIPGGLHAEDLGISYGDIPAEEAMANLLKKHPMLPTYIVPGLIWR